MAQHIWSAFDRLDADDLNDSFAFVRGYAGLGRRGASVATPAGGETVLPLTVTVSDPDSMISSGGLVLPVAGFWLITFEVTLNSGPASAYVGIGLDGSVSWARASDTPALANVALRGSVLRPFAAGAFLELYVSTSAISATIADSAHLGAALFRPT